MMTETSPAAAAAAVVSRQLQIRQTLHPRVGVILGSGLGAAGSRLLESGGRQVSYGDIPGMPTTGIVGHRGRCVAGFVGDQHVVMLQGRAHYYEGHSVAAVTFGVDLLQRLEVRRLIVTNAAGGIHPAMTPGDLMLITGHLNLLPTALPAAPPTYGVRTGHSPWDERLLRHAASVPTTLHIHRGTYAMMPGPNYETPAEIRMLKTLHADAVGMSTVPEALRAASYGMSVLGVSCITNAAAGLAAGTLNHNEVTATAGAIETRFLDWLWRLLQSLPAVR